MVQRRRMHEVSTKKKVFECEACQNTFSQEANLWNHKKVCGGGEASEQSRKMCVCVAESSPSRTSQGTEENV